MNNQLNYVQVQPGGHCFRCHNDYEEYGDNHPCFIELKADYSKICLFKVCNENCQTKYKPKTAEAVAVNDAKTHCTSNSTIPHKSQEATGEECKHFTLPNQDKIRKLCAICRKCCEHCHSMRIEMTGGYCFNERCVCHKPLSSEPSQERHWCSKDCEQCRKIEMVKLTKNHDVEIACLSKPTEVPQDWEERFEERAMIISARGKSMAKFQPVLYWDNVMQENLIEIKAFIRQELSQAEQKGYERGVVEGEKAARHRAVAEIYNSATQEIKDNCQAQLRKAIEEIEKNKKELVPIEEMRDNDTAYQGFIDSGYNQGLIKALAILKKLLD